MALPDPLPLNSFADILRIETVKWQLQRFDQISGMGSGDVLAAQLAPPRIKGTVTLATMYHDQAAQVQALIESLDGPMRSFYLYAPQKAYPSADPDGALLDNMLFNGGFEGGSSSWSAGGVGGGTVTSDAARSGTYSMRLDRPATTYAEIYQGRPASAGALCRASVWVRSDVATSTGIGLIIQFLDGANASLSFAGITTNPASTDWTRVAIEAVAPAGTATAVIRPRLYPSSAAPAVYFDDAHLAVAGATRTPAINSVGANNKSLRLSGLPSGYVLTAGDYLSYDYGSSPTRRAFHRIVETVAADAAGLTPLFEVRPHLASGITTGLSVTLRKPAAKVFIVPETFDPGTARSMVTEGMQFEVMQRP